MIRRSFLIGLFFIGVGCTSKVHVQPQPGFGSVAVMQGATSDQEAQFVVAIPEQENLQIELIDSASNKVLLKVVGRAIRYPTSAWKLVQFRFSDLKENTKYGLRLKGESGNWVDLRFFKTFPKKMQRLRVAATSCLRDDYPNLPEIWNQFHGENAELLLMIGDNTYADLGLDGIFNKMSAETLWQRHMETRNRLGLFRWQNLIPVFATWDDHDYGLNGGGRNFPLKDDSAKIFSSFFPMSLEKSSFSKGPGVARAILLGDQNFVFLDNRSFRAEKGAVGLQVHFGEVQTQWMLGQLKSQSLNWIISGDQFFGAYQPFESFQGNHAQDFKSFMAGLKKMKVPLLFLSGDRHMSEIMKIEKEWTGRETFEITSSPMHSKVYPEAAGKHKNPRRTHAVSGEWNYIVFDISSLPKEFELKTMDRGLSNKTFFQQNLKISKEKN